LMCPFKIDGERRKLNRLGGRNGNICFMSVMTVVRQRRR